MSSPPEWRQWPEGRGGELHMVRRYVGTNGDSVQAYCNQTVPVAETQVPPPSVEGPRCMPCLLNLGQELAARHGGTVMWAP